MGNIVLLLKHATLQDICDSNLIFLKNKHVPPLFYDSVKEVPTPDEFHHDENDVVCLEGVLDADDVRLKGGQKWRTK